MRTLLHAVGGDGAATMDGWKIMVGQVKPRAKGKTATEERASQPAPGSADAAHGAVPAEAVAKAKRKVEFDADVDPRAKRGAIALLEHLEEKRMSVQELGRRCGSKTAFTKLGKRGLQSAGELTQMLARVLRIDEFALLQHGKIVELPPELVPPSIEQVIGELRLREDWPRTEAVLRKIHAQPSKG